MAINAISTYRPGDTRYTQEAFRAFQEFAAWHDTLDLSDVPDDKIISKARNLAKTHGSKVFLPTENAIHFYAGMAEKEVKETYFVRKN